MLTEFESQSTLWLRVNKQVLGYEFILGAVYLPHQMSEYYHEDVFEYLSNDIITTINAVYNVPILLVGDFNSRTGNLTDLERNFDHGGSNIEIDPSSAYLEKHNILHRNTMDKEINKNGKKLIEMCKMSNLKILNGRMGRDRVIGNYTCCTSRGKSVIDYVIASVSFFERCSDFYVDVLDKCMSDVHCPISLVLTSHEANQNTEHDNSKQLELDEAYHLK